LQLFAVRFKKDSRFGLSGTFRIFQPENTPAAPDLIPETISAFDHRNKSKDGERKSGPVNES
jgi:hypothetical protein